MEGVSVLDSISDLNTDISSASQVHQQTVGTSPVREVSTAPTQNRHQNDLQQKPGERRTKTISTGTSPPPQNMSTQVGNT